MRAIRIREFGDPAGMDVIEVAEPIPPAGEVAIRTEAIGVGGVDAVIRRGTLGGSGFRPGHIPGSEVAGEVVEVGPGIDPAWIGRRVWAFTGTGGGYVETALARIENVLPLPSGLSASDAVALGSAGPVAHFALAHARFSPADSVLVRGAAGSLGIMAVQLAARAGARAVAVTTSSPQRGEKLRALGATHVLDRDGAAGQPGAHFDADPGDADVIIDIIGGSALPGFVERLAPNGRIVLVGVVGGYPPADFGISLLTAFQRSLSFATFSLDTVPVRERDRVRAEQFDEAAKGRLRTVVHAVMPLTAAADAHRRMDAGEVFGRIVLTP